MIIIIGAVDRYRGVTEDLIFKCPDIAGGALWSGDSALVGRRGRDIVTGIYSGAALLQGMGEGGAAVVLKGAEEGVFL